MLPFIRLRQGSTLDDLTADGALTLTGSKAARSRFQRVFALP